MQPSLGSIGNSNSRGTRSNHNHLIDHVPKRALLIQVRIPDPKVRVQSCDAGGLVYIYRGHTELDTVQDIVQTKRPRRLTE